MNIKISDKTLKGDCPLAISKIMRDILKTEDENDQLKEHFWVLGLNSRNIVIYIELVSLGTLNASLVHPREVFRFAIQKSVCSIILSHNHPGGEARPSEDDLKLTKRLTDAGEILGIEVLDHIIITENDFFSMKESELI